MATLAFTNAKIFVDGYDISGHSASVTVVITVDMLDETCFGDGTRIHKGGLTTADITGNGYFDTAAGSADQILFALVGQDDKIVTVFPAGITEGGSTPGAYALKGVMEHYNLQGDVASLLQFDFGIMGRGTTV